MLPMAQDCGEKGSGPELEKMPQGQGHDGKNVTSPQLTGRRLYQVVSMKYIFGELSINTFWSQLSCLLYKLCLFGSIVYSISLGSCPFSPQHCQWVILSCLDSFHDCHKDASRPFGAEIRIIVVQLLGQYPCQPNASSDLHHKIVCTQYLNLRAIDKKNALSW